MKTFTIDELIEFQKERADIARKSIEKSKWICIHPELKPYYENNAYREEAILQALLEGKINTIQLNLLKEREEKENV